MSFKFLMQKSLMGDDSRLTQKELTFAFDQNLNSFKNKPPQLIRMNLNTTLDRKQKISTLKLSQLKPIFIKQLKQKKVHQGKYIKVKLIRDCYMMTALHALVEDEKKNICAVAIYNYPFGKKDPLSVFRKDMEIYIKQPYFKISPGGYFNIRIDDPSDIEFEKQVSLMKDISKGTSEEALLHKEDGNKFFADGNFIDALIEYNKAILLEKEEQKLSILWSNKALALLSLRCGNDALSACETSLKYNSNNQKALFRHVLAFILLDQFEKAEDRIEFLENNLSLKGINVLKQRLKIKQNYKEGKFTWKNIFDTYSAEEYFSPKIAIKKSQAANQLSIFAVKQIQPYEILLIEKAIFHINTYDKPQKDEIKSFVHESNYVTGYVEMDGLNIQLRNQAEKIYSHTKDARNRIKALWDHKSSNSNLEQRQNEEISAQTLKQKIVENSFDCSDFKTYIIHGPSQIRGLWEKTSMLNFWCNPNVHVITLNDTMITLSNKSIKKGQQLFINSTCLTAMKGEQNKKNVCSNCSYCQEEPRFNKIAEQLENGEQIYSQKQLHKIIKQFKHLHWRVQLILLLIWVYKKQPPKEFEKLLLQQADITHLAMACSGKFGYEGFASVAIAIVEKFFKDIKVIQNIVHPELFSDMWLEKMMILNGNVAPRFV